MIDIYIKIFISIRNVNRPYRLKISVLVRTNVLSYIYSYIREKVTLFITSFSVHAYFLKTQKYRL
jgi:hypothetical protein